MSLQRDSALFMELADLVGGDVKNLPKPGIVRQLLASGVNINVGNTYGKGNMTPENCVEAGGARWSNFTDGVW